MATREEIREGAIISLMDYFGFERWGSASVIDHVFKYLHSQGVVIKVEGELPETCEGCVLDKLTKNVCSGGCEEKIKLVSRLGYSKTGPLIEIPMIQQAEES